MHPHPIHSSPDALRIGRRRRAFGGGKRFQAQRRGASVIEACLVSPVLVLILLGAVDIGQYVNMAQSVSNASREGARMACRNGVDSVAEVRESIVDYLEEAFPGTERAELEASTTITIRNELTQQELTGDLTGMNSGDPLSVTVNMDFSAIRWMKGIEYWNGKFKVTKTVTRRE